MQVKINEEYITCNEGCTILDLLQQQEISLVNIAVALDEVVIPKAKWGETQLSEGASMLIIRAIQGG